MPENRIVTILLATCLFATFDAQAQATEPAPIGNAEPRRTKPPALDTSSPERLVRSRWALQDWELSVIPRYTKDETFDGIRKEYLGAELKLAAGEFADFLSYQLRKFDEPTPLIKWHIKRDIVEINNESETRAVVTAKLKNLTPIPANIHLGPVYQPDREYGLDVKYILEKTSGQWRLVQALQRDAFGFQSQSSRPGGGWRKAWSVPANPPIPYEFDLARVSP